MPLMRLLIHTARLSMIAGIIACLFSTFSSTPNQPAISLTTIPLNIIQNALPTAVAFGRRSQTIRDAVEYIRQAACGLQYAHEEGLVHRDIKPANLMLDTKGTVKILDLGLALDGDDDEEGGLTKAHDEKVLGTADYLAPEQSKNSHSADPRSDIYALGCTLYYLIVGRAPFARGSVIERIKAHWNEPAPNPLEELEKPPADLDSALIDLYFRMMEKHPDARPQTAGEVSEQLDAWLNQHRQDRPQPAGLRRHTTESPEGSSDSLPTSHSSSITGLRRQPSKKNQKSTVGNSGNLRRTPGSKHPESPDDLEPPDDDADSPATAGTPGSG